MNQFNLDEFCSGNPIYWASSEHIDFENVIFVNETDNTHKMVVAHPQTIGNVIEQLKGMGATILPVWEAPIKLSDMTSLGFGVEFYQSGQQE